MKNIWLQRVRTESSQHAPYLREVWSWIVDQPIYLEWTGFESFEEFSSPYQKYVAAFFALSGDRVIGFFEAIFHDGAEIEIHICLPRRAALRSVFAALQQLEDQLFSVVGAKRIFAYLPEGERREPTFKLAAHLNFKRISDEECAITRAEWEKLKSPRSATLAA